MQTYPRILLLEDDPNDTLLLRLRLKQERFNCELTDVRTRQQFEAALTSGEFDLIVSDYQIPGYDGLAALSFAHAHRPQIPFVFLSGTIGEDRAVESLQKGAADYIVKSHSQRLVPALRRALEHAAEHQRRLKAEQSLRESEERFRLLAENSNEIFWFVALHPERILYVSPAVERIRGMRPQEFMSCPRLWVQSVHPDDRERVVQAYEAWLDGRQPGFDEEHRIIRPDGSILWVHSAGTVIRRQAHRIEVVCGITRDITERKQAEESMRQALATLDTVEDAALIFDPGSLRLRYVNEGAVRQLGYTREELLARSVEDFAIELAGSPYRDRIEAMINGGAPMERFTARHRHKDGHDFPVEINLQYVAPAGAEPRCVSIVRDITEREKTERAARRSQRLESIGTLAGGVAHDLNNSLTPILMATELLRTETAAKDSHLLDLIHASAQRAADMVRQLLAFAKGAEGRRVPIQLHRLCAEVENIIKATFPKNIELRCEAPKDLPVIEGDPTQLHQVIVNLCLNARDAMPRGGTLTIQAGQVSVDEALAASSPDAKPGEHLAIRVCDTGTGIPPEIIDRIFDPFYTTKDPEKGTGLGLSTVMGIAKGHGGFVHVESAPNRGSTFTVFLRLQAASGHIAPPPPSQPFHGKGQTILVVEDEPHVRALSLTVLRRYHFKPIPATDGVDALIRLSECRSSLGAVITDLHMPHMDGVTFVRALRRVLPDIPVIVCSGCLEQQHAEELKRLGVLNRLDKPYSQQQLVHALSQALQGAARDVLPAP